MNKYILLVKNDSIGKRVEINFFSLSKLFFSIENRYFCRQNFLHLLPVATQYTHTPLTPMNGNVYLEDFVLSLGIKSLDWWETFDKMTLKSSPLVWSLAFMVVAFLALTKGAPTTKEEEEIQDHPYSFLIHHPSESGITY